ncbi:MAB_1171c family putative transporter [Amycolatopsis sp. La24]|uniref:MAB_1171c family putative transporter n=1 Tax=Amycolatopsis sp. La24 TaxID=3028304 RepID=UPI0023AEFBC3|nr:MAB_1171c family putative transporter [Amycolatopsis sp. La24]
MNLTNFLLLVLVWFLYRLARSPRDPALWAVVVCIAFQLLGASAVAVFARTVFGEVLTPSTVRLLANLALNTSRYALLLFFLISSGGSWRRVRIETCILAAVCVAMTAAMLMLPPGVRDSAYPLAAALPNDMGRPGVALFYAIGGGYTFYAAVQAARWALRYAAESGRRVEFGLRVVAVALVLAAVVNGIRAVVTIVRWTGWNGYGAEVLRLTDRLAPVSIFVFFAGVLSIGLVARFAVLRNWLRRRRAYAELWPLWRALHAVFPADTLDHAPTRAWPDTLLPHRVGHRYWRRVIEIRDGLLQIGPQLLDAGFDPNRPADEQVAIFRRALQFQADGRVPSTRKAVLVAAPEDSGINSDVRQLINLSRALAREGAQ